MIQKQTTPTPHDKRVKTLYVSDMDGTLLNSESVLSQYTTATLNRLIADGALFTVATARTPATVVKLMKDVQATVPYIVMTGAALWDSNADTYRNVRAMTNDTVGEILDVFNSHAATADGSKNAGDGKAVNPFVYRRHGNALIVSHVSTLTPEEREFIVPRVQTRYKSLRLVGHLEAQDADEPIIMFSMGPYATVRAIAQEIKSRGIACSPACYYDIFDNTQGILDIYAPDTNKADAVRRLAADLGAERIVVFGDNRNDLSMMRVATHSVAVGNAFDEVKAEADEVIGSNDDDAVVKWIEQDMMRLSPHNHRLEPVAQ